MNDFSQTLVGISPGASFSEPTTGICVTGPRGFHVARTFADKLSRRSVLALDGPSPVIAVGAPVLPEGTLNAEPRMCEKVFHSVPFYAQCAGRKTSGGGPDAAVRRAGCDTALQWSSEARGAVYAGIFPQACRRTGIVEASPRVFLGVMLPDRTFDDLPAGVRLTGLLERCVEQGSLNCLEGLVRWPDRLLWAAASSSERYQEEAAAIVCALTAVCVWTGQYVAVGETLGGWVFLPPWRLWQPWARTGLERNRSGTDRTREVEVWVNGRRYDPKVALPT